MPSPHVADPRFARWMEGLETRHLANLRFAEVTRALRALSSAYVERRHDGGTRKALDSAGKRAAFALFYAPLHLLTTAHVVQHLWPDVPPPTHITDLGCGTGAAGAGWALAADGAPSLTGIDRHHWAAEEAKWTYAQLGLRGRARTGDVTSPIRAGEGHAVLLAYVLNELPDAVRRDVEDHLLRAAESGTRILILEPISRQVAPWWTDTASRFVRAGFRDEEWRFGIELPPLVRKFDEAAGLDHRVLTARTLSRT